MDTGLATGGVQLNFVGLLRFVAGWLENIWSFGELMLVQPYSAFFESLRNGITSLDWPEWIEAVLVGLLNGFINVFTAGWAADASIGIILATELLGFYLFIRIIKFIVGILKPSL